MVGQFLSAIATRSSAAAIDWFSCSISLTAKSRWWSQSSWRRW
jgi:hypothetical protein